MKKKISMNGLIKIVPLAILCIVTGMINPVFFAGSNLIDLARSVSFLLIVSAVTAMYCHFSVRRKGLKGSWRSEEAKS